MNALTGKVAIVTGASSGIGRAAALLFAQNGARVVMGARRQAELDSLVAQIHAAGGEAHSVAGDVRDEAYAQRLVQRAVEHFGGLDVAFNNAGIIGESGPTPGISAAGWQEAIDTNLTSAFYGAKHQIPAVLARGGGSILFTSTFVGHTVGFTGVAAYAASKAGLIGLTKALAKEEGPSGITVNCVAPGVIDTDMMAAFTAEDKAALAEETPVGRLGSADEVAQLLVFLAGEGAGYITGQVFGVNGGLVI
jgi:NAD(P)-dependent dehydrogenase (short-subunit alcohol dehydrogenase family)